MAPRASRLRFGVLLALVAPACALALAALPAAGAAGEGAKPAPRAASDAGERYDPDNVTGISQYVEDLVKAVEKYQAKDYTAAVDAIKKAIPKNPKHPLGHYLLGEVYLATNNLGEAEAAFLAAREANDPKQAALRGHVLFSVADVYEREKKWEDAKSAWQAYADWAAKAGHDGGAHPQSSAERLKVAQKILELEKQYAAVRERIAAEKDGGLDSGKGGATPPAGTAPAPKK